MTHEKYFAELEKHLAIQSEWKGKDPRTHGEADHECG